jgi:CRP/FNR family cyclic AMP-dependent transcriptional regulator
MDAAEMLATIPLFDDLSADDVKDLAEHVKPWTFKEGEIIVRQGEDGDSMFLIREGTVRVFLNAEDGSEVNLRELTVGQYFGEFSLFDEKPRSAGTAALSDCELLELERDTLREHIMRRPRIAIAVLAEMSERMRETNALLTHRAATDVNKQVEAQLTFGDRIADRVAEVAGSWAFILSFIGLLVGWCVFNSLAVSKMLSGKEPFDPFPFIFFNLILSIVAALQGPVIMMSQNRQSLKDRAQAETTFKVNLKNEIGIETLQRGQAEMKAHLALLERIATGRKPAN